MKYSLRFLLNFAKQAAKFSNCKRTQVGAVCVSATGKLTFGYNHTPDCNTPCEENDVTLDHVIHAEISAMAGVKEPDILVITHSPCLSCATEIVKRGVKVVFFEESYRLKDGLNYLSRNNVIFNQIGEDSNE